jgi:hypothetical protein
MTLEVRSVDCLIDPFYLRIRLPLRKKMLVPQIILTAYIFPFVLLLPFGLEKFGATNIFQKYKQLPVSLRERTILFLISLPQPDF